MSFSRNKFGFGVILLFVSGVLCKVLGAFFRLPLTNLLGFEGIGVFQMIMTLYSFSLILTSGGISATIAKLVSSALAKKQYGKISKYLARSLLVGVGSGLVVGTLFFFFERQVCLFQGIETNQSYMLFLILLPFGAVSASLRGFFQGYGNMMPTAVSQIVEQICKFGFGLFFAYLFGKISVSSGVFGAFLGIVASEVIACLVLFVWFLLKREKGQSTSFSSFERKEFDRTNFWIVLSVAIIPLTKAFDSVFVVPKLVQAGFSSEFAIKLFGLQSGVVGAILNLPLVVSVAITTALLPNVSYSFSSGASSKNAITKGMKILILSILPATFGILAISKQILPLCYSEMGYYDLQIVFNLMVYESFSIVFCALAQFLSTILLANGNLKFIVFVQAIAGAVKMFFTFILTAQNGVNIYALALGNVVMFAIIAIIFLAKVKTVCDVSIKPFEIFVLLFSTFSMFFASYTFLKRGYFGAIADIVIAIMIGIVVYAVFSVPVLMKVFSKRKKNE